MKTYKLLLAGLMLSSFVIHAEPGTPYPLVEVEDGDTIAIRVNGETKRLQLAGIDAPEDVANPKLTKDLERTGLSAAHLLALGQAATAHLKQLASPGDRVTVVGDLDSQDKYGRIPVFAYRDGLSLNAAMVADGYAVVLARAPLAVDIKAELNALQQQAQQGKQGLWGSHYSEAMLWSGQ